MKTYTRQASGTIVTDDGRNIPPDPKNRDYAAVQADVAKGTAEVVDEATPAVPADTAKACAARIVSAIRGALASGITLKEIEDALQ
jgi:hypothetical protein